jgi:sugar (glycoside-pentoside-hexuronide) transporter
MSRGRLMLFAFGDFAFNLYWQSIMLFLLFYYTEALALPVEIAATIYTVATIWDGVLNFLVGTLADRWTPRRGYGRIVMLGSVPLGLACVLTYLPPPVSGFWGLAIVLIGHLLFRTAYAAVNIPYLAMSARISSDSGDRAFIAGARMLFGTAAWVVVARGTMPIGAWIAGSRVPALAYLGAAILFAVLATTVLLVVGASYREQVQIAPGPRSSIGAALRSIAGNRAFLTLNGAMMAMIVAVTVLNKSVLYYFKYFLHDEAAGQAALGWMGLMSAAAVPVWMLVQRRLGGRALWFVATGLCLAGLAVFALFRIGSAGAMQVYLVAMQSAIVGLHFTFWAMLPNTIEYGERATGLRAEGTVFGLAALLQRVAIGIATGIVGIGFGSAGYVANLDQSAATLAAMRWTIVLAPIGFFALSWALMALNPLRHGAHRRIVREMSGASD